MKELIISPLTAASYFFYYSLWKSKGGKIELIRTGLGTKCEVKLRNGYWLIFYIPSKGPINNWEIEIVLLSHNAGPNRPGHRLYSISIFGGPFDEIEIKEEQLSYKKGFQETPYLAKEIKKIFTIFSGHNISIKKTTGSFDEELSDINISPIAKRVKQVVSSLCIQREEKDFLQIVARHAVKK